MPAKPPVIPRVCARSPGAGRAARARDPRAVGRSGNAGSLFHLAAKVDSGRWRNLLSIDPAPPLLGSSATCQNQPRLWSAGRSRPLSPRAALLSLRFLGCTQERTRSSGIEPDRPDRAPRNRHGGAAADRSYRAEVSTGSTGRSSGPRSDSLETIVTTCVRHLPDTANLTERGWACACEEARAPISASRPFRSPPRRRNGRRPLLWSNRPPLDDEPLDVSWDRSTRLAARPSSSGTWCGSRSI
jgi:hypothetical protein